MTNLDHFFYYNPIHYQLNKCKMIPYRGLLDTLNIFSSTENIHSHSNCSNIMEIVFFHSHSCNFPFLTIHFTLNRSHDHYYNPIFYQLNTFVIIPHDLDPFTLLIPLKFYKQNGFLHHPLTHATFLAINCPLIELTRL